MTDSLQRFVFDHLDARGAIVRLSETSEAIQTTHHYPTALAILLNQFAAAVCLLRDSIKVDANVTVQLRSPGSVDLIMADCLADRRVRAIAEYDAESFPSVEEIDLTDLGEGSVLAITITPTEGERYQGVVPIEYPSLAQCLEDYFARSEQLPSWFALLANEESSVGVVIHTLPAEKVQGKEQTQEDFARLQMLLATLKAEEALALNNQEILTRLFHEESCRLFEAKDVEFGCECSAQKSLDAVASLGASEVEALVAEQKEEGKNSLVVDCHFCFQRYEFGWADVLALLDEKKS